MAIKEEAQNDYEGGFDKEVYPNKISLLYGTKK